eukprot:scaffold64136_cov25-Tisochrysis_lutea.AAC.1
MDRDAFLDQPHPTGHKRSRALHVPLDERTDGVGGEVRQQLERGAQAGVHENTPTLSGRERRGVGEGRGRRGRAGEGRGGEGSPRGSRAGERGERKKGWDGRRS